MRGDPEIPQFLPGKGKTIMEIEHPYGIDQGHLNKNLTFNPTPRFRMTPQKHKTLSNRKIKKLKKYEQEKNAIKITRKPISFRTLILFLKCEIFFLFLLKFNDNFLTENFEIINKIKYGIKKYENCNFVNTLFSFLFCGKSNSNNQKLIHESVMYGIYEMENMLLFCTKISLV
jgi:hypothetical protein